MPHFVKLDENGFPWGRLLIYFFCKFLDPVKGRSSGYALEFGSCAYGQAMVIQLYNFGLYFGRKASGDKGCELVIAPFALISLLPTSFTVFNHFLSRALWAFWLFVHTFSNAKNGLHHPNLTLPSILNSRFYRIASNMKEKLVKKKGLLSI